MAMTVEAILYPDGTIRLNEPITLDGPMRVVVEILDSAPTIMESTLTETPQHVVVKTCRYRILKQLGRGGMSETYQAEDTNSGALVCIKRLHSLENQRSLMQECRALARLSHPYIVRLLDFDTISENPYLVTEYVEGTPLGALVRRIGALPQEAALQLCLRVFKTIAYAHSQDVIHRDLKPSNMIIASPEQDLIPRILDFGLAIVSRRDERDAITAVRSFAGTLNYMAPEQIEGVELSGACDVYAIGQILWELIVGKPAFVGPTFCQVCDEKLALEDGLRLDVHNGSSDPLSRLISNCTSKNPQQRPTATEAVEIIRDIILHTPSKSRL
jgi:serine/threonine-protein kinase